MGLKFTQLINGIASDFSSIVVALATPAPVIITRFTEVSWKYSLTPGILRGNSAHKLARTRGTFDCTGSLTLYEDEWDTMRLALNAAPMPPGGGYMEKAFLVTVTVGNPAAPPIVSILEGARITEVDRTYSQSADALMVKLSLDIMKVKENGDSPVRDKSGIV